MNENLNFVILVDGENAQSKKYTDILNEVARKGSIAIKWVYADWTLPNNRGWKDILLDTGSYAPARAQPVGEPYRRI
ncbi:TPA: NYN domain-containing protein [Vibrio metschnikovii]